MDSTDGFSVGRCDGCGRQDGPLVKMSLGKDFFGRPYDRLSPSYDQSPKWYCESCSMHKNLQRDFRDIRAEFEKLRTGQSSELRSPEQVQRAHLRLREIAALLGGSIGSSPLLPASDVDLLIRNIQAQAGLPSVEA